jgi:signal transduction histidine kinase
VDGRKSLPEGRLQPKLAALQDAFAVFLLRQATCGAGSRPAGESTMKRESTKDQLRQAGATLHDEVAPLLAGAGLQLQLLRMDHPAATAQVNEVLATLEAAMDEVRKLSQQLAPSPFTPAGS